MDFWPVSTVSETLTMRRSCLLLPTVREITTGGEKMSQEMANRHRASLAQGKQMKIETREFLTVEEMERLGGRED